LVASLPACACSPHSRACCALPGVPTLSISPGATRTTFPPAVSFFRASSRTLRWTPLDASTSPGLPCRSAHPFRGSPPAPEIPLSEYGPRPGFLTLFAAFSSHGLASLFHPANALRLLPSGIFPLEELRQLFAVAMPSCRSSAVALPPPSMAGPTAHQPSPLGKWGRCLWPTSRLCSPRESVPTAGGIGTRRRPSPSWAFPSPRRSPPVRRRGSSPRAPPVRFSGARSIELPQPSARRMRFGVSIAQEVALPLSRLPCPPEVCGRLVLTMQRRWVLAYRFASGSRLRRRPL